MRPRKKGYRQGYLKRFHSEYINAGQRYAPKMVADHYDIYNPKSRVRSTIAAQTTRYENNTEHYKQSAVLNLEPEDVVLVRLREMWQSDFWQGVSEYNRINLILSEDRNLFLFFQGESFFFVKEYPKKKIVERSVIYSSRKIAFMHMDAGKITWITKPVEALYDLPR